MDQQKTKGAAGSELEAYVRGTLTNSGHSSKVIESLVSLFLQGEAYARANRWEEAERVSEQLAALFKNLRLGNEHDLVLLNLYHRAICLDNIPGRQREAIPLFSQVVLSRQQSGAPDAGPFGLMTLDAVVRCANNLITENKYTQAAGMLERSWPMLKQSAGVWHERTVHAQAKLAWALWKSKQLGRVQDVAQSLVALGLDRQSYAQTDLSIRIHIVEATQILGAVKVEMQQAREGLELLRHAVSLAARTFGEESISFLHTLRTLGLQLNSLRKWAEALPVHEKAWEVCQLVHKPPLSAAAYLEHHIMYAHSLLFSLTKRLNETPDPARATQAAALMQQVISRLQTMGEPARLKLAEWQQYLSGFVAEFAWCIGSSSTTTRRHSKEKLLTGSDKQAARCEGTAGSSSSGSGAAAVSSSGSGAAASSKPLTGSDKQAARREGTAGSSSSSGSGAAAVSSSDSGAAASSKQLTGSDKHAACREGAAGSCCSSGSGAVASSNQSMGSQKHAARRGNSEGAAGSSSSGAAASSKPPTRSQKHAACHGVS